MVHTRFTQSVTTAVLLFGAISLSLFLAATPPGHAQAERTYPSKEQCWEGVSKAYGNGTGFINTCKSGERLCPNAGFASRRTGIRLPNTPECIPKTAADLAAERAEANRKARFEADVKLEMNRLGAHREAEIRRKLELRDKAMAARPNAPEKQCTTQTVTRTGRWQGKTQNDATLAGNRGVTNICGADKRLSSSGLTCTPDPTAELRKPPIGTCAACISEKQAIALGYVPGSGWPKQQPRWTCRATAQCSVEKCTSSPAAVSKQ